MQKKNIVVKLNQTIVYTTNDQFLNGFASIENTKRCINPRSHRLHRSECRASWDEKNNNLKEMTLILYIVD
jgi:hypothetical protein